MPFFTPLSHRALISVQGEDHLSFLQGMISNDVRHLESGQAMWAAFLTPQGKFLHEFFAVPHDQSVLLECERERRADLITRLSRYRLRAKVTLAPDDTLVVGVAWGEGASAALKTAEDLGAVTRLGAGVLYTDPRLLGAGVRWALPADHVGAPLEKSGLTAASLANYDTHRMTLGLPDGSRDLEIEKALLLENGFAELHGVDFNKGCYIGQELTARTHYRALIKKRLMPVTIDGDAPAFGTSLTANGVDAGELRSVSGNRGLALVKLEAWRTASGGVLEAGSAKITPHLPAWMELPA